MLLIDSTNIKKTILAIFIVYGLTISTIQIIAPIPEITNMPERCSENSANCARLAHDGTNYRIENIEPLSINAPISEVKYEIEKWLNDQLSGGVLHTSIDENNLTFIHGVTRTEFLFFPDDLFAGITCNTEGDSVVTLQSQSRLGKGDLGKNPERIVELNEYLNQINWSGDSCN
tara:strand:+ start:39 stop:560 length:522 start_codon:yes stop_codon:yes gene_type:complete